MPKRNWIIVSIKTKFKHIKNISDKYLKFSFFLKKIVSIRKNKAYFKTPKTPFVDKKISVEFIILIKKKVTVNTSIIN